MLKELFENEFKKIDSYHININQRYGKLSYISHLDLAIHYCHKYIELIPIEDRKMVYIAVRGHDIIEDPSLTYNDVKELFDERIANIIYAVSNEKGKTREERANDKYYQGIVDTEYAIFTKLCDRLANYYFSCFIERDVEKFNKYKAEMEHFKSKLYTEEYKIMWDDLESMESKTKCEDAYPNVTTFYATTIKDFNTSDRIDIAIYYELFRKGVLEKSSLEKNTYYYGVNKHGTATCGYWNGYEFMIKETVLKYVPHFEIYGNDFFIPLYKSSFNKLEITI